MGFATTVWVAALIWGLNGWFQSAGAPGGVVAMTAWFSNRERGRLSGIWSTAHSIGEGLTFLRSEEHTSELQSLMRISYAVFCLKNNTPSSKPHQLICTNA